MQLTTSMCPGGPVIRGRPARPRGGQRPSRCGRAGLRPNRRRRGPGPPAGAEPGRGRSPVHLSGGRARTPLRLPAGRAACAQTGPGGPGGPARECWDGPQRGGRARGPRASRTSWPDRHPWTAAAPPGPPMGAVLAGPHARSWLGRAAGAVLAGPQARSWLGRAAGAVLAGPQARSWLGRAAGAVLAGPQARSWLGRAAGAVLAGPPPPDGRRAAASGGGPSPGSPPKKENAHAIKNRRWSRPSSEASGAA
jgi:hypothetical protein